MKKPITLTLLVFLLLGFNKLIAQEALEMEEIIQKLVYNNELKEYFRPEIKAVIVCPYACEDKVGHETIETSLGRVAIFYTEEWKGTAFQLGWSNMEAILIHDIIKQKDKVEIRLKLTDKKDQLRIVIKRNH